MPKASHRKQPRSEAPVGLSEYLKASLGLTTRSLVVQPGRPEHWSVVALCGALILLVVPFLTRAFHVDDPLFIWAARNIQTHPADPYGFSVNWYGAEEPFSTITMNPPGVSYYLAGVGSLFGLNEVAAHAALLLPLLAVAAGTYLLARRFTGRPLLAAALGTLTPVFFVSGLTVMSDMLMLAWWVFAVLLWIRGLESTTPSRHWLFLLSALLTVLAIVTKYFGAALIPLLLVYSVAKTKRISVSLVYLLIPAAALVGYEILSRKLYGHGALFDAAAYATTSSIGFGRGTLAKLGVNLAFLGGCLATGTLFAARLWSWRQLMVGVATAIVVFVTIASLDTFGPFSLPTDRAERLWFAAQIAVWIVSGGGWIALAVLDGRRNWNADSLLLCAWFLGTWVFAAYVNWTMNGRSILPAMVPAGILLARRLESGVPRPTLKKPATLIHLVAAGALSVAVAWADTTLAGVSRNAASQIGRNYSGTRRIWFQGHWGFQYYLEQFGAKAMDVTRRSLTPVESATPWSLVPGDIFVIPRANNTNLYPVPQEWISLREVIELPSTGWIATVNNRIGAGFYSDVSGPLPFAFGLVKPEQFVVFDVRSGVSR